MLRAAAKNHTVTVIIDPNDYPKVLNEIRKSNKTTPLRKYLPIKFSNKLLIMMPL